MRELKLSFVIVAVLLYAGCAGTASNTSVAVNTQTPNSNSKPASSVTPAPPQPAVETVSGAELYKNTCSKCHKEDGTGGKVTIEGKEIDPDNLTTAKMAAKTDVQMTKYIVEGFPEDGMPAFKGRLKDDEIKAIITYIRSDLQKGVQPAPPANK